MNYIFKYYQGIQNGSIIVGKWVKLLYEKILDGIEDHTYYYSQEKCDNCINFIERYCHHNKGILAPGYLKLDLWQKAGLSLMYGILDPVDMIRQFNETVWIVGRKMGKTLIASSNIAYFAYAVGEFGSEIYCVAPKLGQSDLVYSAFKFTVDQERSFSRITKQRKNDLFISKFNTTIQKLPFTDKRSDGYNPMFFVADELAAWPGQKGLRQWEAMTSGNNSRLEPMGLGISSGGYENEGIYDELIKRGTAFLNGNSREKHLLPLFYMIDDIEKWDDINELYKSLPGLGVSISVKAILSEIDIAHESLSKKTEFITKYCNIKQNSSLAWFTAQDVKKAFGNQFTFSDFTNTYALGGLDLSQTTDLTSACVLIERGGIIYVFSHFWLPSEKLQTATERDGIPYQAMITRGFLSLSGDNFVDYHDCFNWFKDLIEKYQIYPLMTGYDRYSAQYLVQDMETYGFHCESVYQGYNLTGIEDNLEGLLKNGTIQCADDNDLLKIHFLDAAQQIESNTSAHPRKKLVKISKTAHVDGVAAILDALCMRQNHWSEYGDRLKNAE